MAPYNVYEIRIEDYDDSLRCPPNHTIPLSLIGSALVLWSAVDTVQIVGVGHRELVPFWRGCPEFILVDRL